MGQSVEHDRGGPLLCELCNVPPQMAERVGFLAVLGINRVSGGGGLWAILGLSGTDYRSCLQCLQASSR